MCPTIQSNFACVLFGAEQVGLSEIFINYYSVSGNDADESAENEPKQ